MKKGRPRKATEQLRGITKNIRYTKEEWSIIQDKLDQSGLSFSEFIRRASYRAEIVPVDMDAIQVLRDAKVALNKIGANINMLARNSANILNTQDYQLFMGDLINCSKIAKELTAQLTIMQKFIS